jgi:hypothetical protein
MRWYHEAQWLALCAERRLGSGQVERHHFEPYTFDRGKTHAPRSPRAACHLESVRRFGRVFGDPRRRGRRIRSAQAHGLDPGPAYAGAGGRRRKPWLVPPGPACLGRWRGPNMDCRRPYLDTSAGNGAPCVGDAAGGLRRSGLLLRPRHLARAIISVAVGREDRHLDPGAGFGRGGDFGPRRRLDNLGWRGWRFGHRFGHEPALILTAGLRGAGFPIATAVPRVGITGYCPVPAPHS